MYSAKTNYLYFYISIFLYIWTTSLYHSDAWNEITIRQVYVNIQENYWIKVGFIFIPSRDQCQLVSDEVSDQKTEQSKILALNSLNHLNIWKVPIWKVNCAKTAIRNVIKIAFCLFSYTYIWF